MADVFDPEAYDPDAGALRRLGWALSRRCPGCGARGIFAGYWTLRDRCPRCHLGFTREAGYWVGAMIVNIGGAQLVFFALFLGGLALTWPQVPWTALLIAGLATMAVFPVAFYPWSKALWLWGDLVIRGHQPDWHDADL